jgi:hypothetical protein
VLLDAGGHRADVVVRVEHALDAVEEALVDDDRERQASARFGVDDAAQRLGGQA